MNETPTISICSYCQKEFPEIDKAVRETSSKNTIKFSHGICKRHVIEMYKEMGAEDEQIQNVLSRTKSSIPDLKENPKLIKAYSQGLFTPEQIQQAQQSLQESNDKITDRFKKLAGINS